MPKVLGASLSPFVRKVRVALAEKGIAYDLEPVVPGMFPDDFKAKSPLGKIPVYEDGDFVLPDSSCIIAYLERVHPTPALYPSDPHDYARALFLEEYADTKLLEATLPFFQQNVLFPRFFKRPSDPAALEAARGKQDEIFGYLEGRLEGFSGDGIVGGRFSIADIALVSPLINMQHGEGTVDPKRFPRLAGYLATVEARPSIKPLIEEERAGIPAS